MSAHLLEVVRVMRPDPTHPTHLEATGDVSWACTCGEFGTCAADGLDEVRDLHNRKAK